KRSRTKTCLMTKRWKTISATVRMKHSIAAWMTIRTTAGTTASQEMSDIDPRSEVAYLGPPGTYSHAALVQYFGPEQRSYPVGDIPDVFSRVEKGESEYGLVPVENSSEGSVTLTL